MVITEGDLRRAGVVKDGAHDDPVAIPDTTYCTPERLGMSFNGMAGNVVFLSCHTPGTPMTWNLVDPDALNVSGDEGPRSDTSTARSNG